MSDLNADHRQLRELADWYAEAVDGHRPELLDSIMAIDAVIEGPHFRMAGIAEIRGIPAMLKNLYIRTRHEIHRQVVMIEGESAAGETSCTASHFFLDADKHPQALIWHLRYLDTFGKIDGRWRFLARKLEIDRTDTVPVDPA